MSSRYDRAVTIFSPDGHLLQVEYAQEAVRKGSTAVGVLGPNCIVLGVEKRTVEQLQVDRSVHKIQAIDKHISLSFAGLSADARVLIDRAKSECQTHRLTLEDPVTVEYITKYIAELKQKYTQSNGLRPFGISCLIGGFDEDGSPHLYETEPSGNYYGWLANAIGRSGKTARDYFEKYYNEKVVAYTDGVVKLAIKGLLEVAEHGPKNIEIAILERDVPMYMLDQYSIMEYVSKIEEEKKIEAEKKTHNK